MQELLEELKRQIKKYGGVPNFALRVGVTQPTISMIINQKMKVSVKFAVRLDKFLGGVLGLKMLLQQMREDYNLTARK